MVTTKLYINNKDAYTTWGLQLDEGGYDALTAFKSLKEPVVNKNLTAQGAVIVTGTGLVDERSVSVPMHIVASSYTDFEQKKQALFLELKSGALSIVVKDVWTQRVGGVVKTLEQEKFSSTMTYQSCSQYTQFAQQPNKRYVNGTDSWTTTSTGYGIAKFILSMYEPNGPIFENTLDSFTFEANTDPSSLLT